MNSSIPDIRDLLPTPVPIAVIRSDDAGEAMRMAEAVVAGGLTTVELTLTTPNAIDVIGQLTGSDVLVGAGTVTSAAEVEQVVDAGARFIVSPGLSTDVVRAAQDAGRVVVPGVLTPTELMAARAAGATAVKLFPADTVGIGHLKALRSVFPEMAFMPTGGIGLESVPDWINAGAAAVGIGGVLNRVYRDSGHAGLVTLASQLVRSVDAAGDADRS